MASLEFYNVSSLQIDMVENDPGDTHINGESSASLKELSKNADLQNFQNIRQRMKC
jgi:hypothetical protein